MPKESEFIELRDRILELAMIERVPIGLDVIVAHRHHMHRVYAIHYVLWDGMQEEKNIRRLLKEIEKRKQMVMGVKPRYDGDPDPADPRYYLPPLTKS